MKVVREYKMEKGKLICRSYIVPTDSDGFVDPVMEQVDEVKLVAHISPDPSGYFLRVSSGNSVSMSLAVSEVVRFCETLKKMYDL